MKNNWFEKKLDERLSNKEEPLDLGDLWNQLEDKRNPKKGNRGFIWFFFGLLGVVIISSLWFFDLNNQQKGLTTYQSESDVIIDRSDKIIPFSQESNSKFIDKTSDNTLANDHALQDTDESLLNLSTTKNQLNKTQAKLKKTVILQSSANQTLGESPNSKKINPSNHLANHTFNNTINPTNKSFLEDGSYNHIIKPTLKINNQKLPYLGRLSQIQSRIRFQRNQHELTRNVVFLKKITVHQPSFRKSWSLAFEQYFGKSQRNFSNVEMGNFLIQRRNLEEEFQDFQKQQLILRRNISENFFFETGIAYSQYTSKTDFQVDEIKVSTTLDTVEIILDPSGQFLSALEGQVEIVNSETWRRIKFQKYSSISIPFHIAYQFNFNSKSRLSLISGINLRIMNLSRGFVAKDYFDFNNYTDLKDAGYDTQFGWEADFQLNYERSINEVTSLVLGVNTHFDMSNRLKSNLDIRDKFRSLNAKVAVICRL